MHSRCFATLPMTSDFRNPFLIDNKIIFLEKSLFWVINAYSKNDLICKNMYYVGYIVLIYS